MSIDQRVVMSAAEEVTVDLASHYLCVINFSGLSIYEFMATLQR